jgi:hypothetical protein
MKLRDWLKIATAGEEFGNFIFSKGPLEPKQADLAPMS